MEFMTAYDDIISKLNPSTLEKIRRASEIQDNRQALPSLGLTKSLNGGLLYGGQTTLWGNRSSGKTMLALMTAGMAQKEGKSVAFIQPEKSLTPDWGRKLGVNVEELITSPVGSISHCTDVCIDLMHAGIDMIIVDSISALLPQSYFGDKDELKDLEKTGQIGQFSKDVGKMVGMFNYTNENTALVLISQIRTDLSGYHASMKPMGGKAMDHFNTTSIKLWSSAADAEQIKGTVKNDKAIIEQNIGRKINWTLDKDRGAGMGTSGSYDMYYAGDFVGIDTIGELVDYGVLYGNITKGGAWFNLENGEKFQGKAKLVSYLRENEVEFEKLKEQVVG